MKKNIFLFLLFTCLASANAIAGDVKAYLLYSTFNSPGKGPYVETYLSVIGNSVVFSKNANGKYQGAIEISMAFRKGEEIKAVKKYNLLSPEIADSSAARANFLDLQRIPLENGEYELDITIADINKGGKPFSSTQKIAIDFDPAKIAVSDIQLVESYTKSTSPGVLTKSGYDLVPYVSNFYPGNMKKLSFYAEVYNSKKILGENEKFLINYYLESAETKVKMSSFRGFSKQTANDVNIVFSEFAIDELMTGNYYFVVEVKNKLNETVVRKTTFIQRSNPNGQLSIYDMASLNLDNSFVAKITSKDTLADYIRSLYPISNSLERTFAENQVKKRDLREMQQYFLGYWMNRNQATPEAAWVMYNTEVQKVNKTFGTQTKRGYDTDRGRVYLQYGAPNQRTESTYEPSAYPYEIWHYYKLPGQSNRKFVFYNPDLVTNDYQLLHSDAKGEINDPRWELRIHERGNNQVRSIDTQKPRENMGSRSSDSFRNPR